MLLNVSQLGRSYKCPLWARTVKKNIYKFYSSSNPGIPDIGIFTLVAFTIALANRNNCNGQSFLFLTWDPWPPSTPTLDRCRCPPPPPLRLSRRIQDSRKNLGPLPPIDGHNWRWIDGLIPMVSIDIIDRYFWSHFHLCYQSIG